MTRLCRGGNNVAEFGRSARFAAVENGENLAVWIAFGRGRDISFDRQLAILDWGRPGMKRLVSGLAVVCALGCTTANAADFGQAYRAAGHNWTGWYVGGFVGGETGATTGDISQPLFNGLDAGVHILYNMQTPSNWVVSPFVAVPIPGKTDTLFGTVNVKLDWALIGGVRLGYAMERWLPYGFLGAAVGAATADSGFGSNTHVGYTAGAGVDYALDDRWTVGARYAFISVGGQNYNGTNVGWQGHSIAATVSYKLH
jgi:outer membrane immunogenic protein